jgi:hypothetical protein
MRLALRRSMLAVAIVTATPLLLVSSAPAVPIVAPPVPLVAAWGSFTGTECVNLTEPGVFHDSFTSTFATIPLLGAGTLEYDTTTASGGTSQGSWSMSTPTGSISGTHVQIATRTITQGQLQVEFVDNFTVTSSTGDAIGVTGKMQGFGVGTFTSLPLGCFLTFVTSGSLLPALKKN